MRLSNQANLRNGSVGSVVQPSAKCWAWPGARIQVASLVIMLALLFTSAAQLVAQSFKTIDYPGATYTYANGINAFSQIVGSWEDASFNSHGFLYSGGKFTSLDYPGASSTTAVGINNAGQIVGSYTSPNG